MTTKLSTRIVCFIVTFVMVFLILPANVMASATEAIAEAANTSNEEVKEEVNTSSVTVINTAEELYKVRENLGGTFVLASDIDLSESEYSENWIPIGTKDAPFTGLFMGGTFTIKGMKISALTEMSGDGYYYAGLFGYNQGTICDLRIEGEITASTVGKKAVVGSLVGFNDGKVVNCSDGVSYDDFDLDPTSLMSSVFDIDDYVENAMIEMEMLVVGKVYAFHHKVGDIKQNLTFNQNSSVRITGTFDSSIVPSSTFYRRYSYSGSFTFTIDECDYPAVYIILDNVKSENFSLSSNTTKDVYIVSTGYHNRLYAQTEKPVFDFPNANVTIIGDAPLTIYGDAGSSGVIGSHGSGYRDEASDSKAACGSHGGSGGNGEDGTIAVSVGKTFTVALSDDSKVTIYGGDGGDGGNGGNGYGGASGGHWNNGDGNQADDGKHGGDGGNGGNGGNGGHGATGLIAGNVIATSTLEVFSGNGGNCGAGGAGGQGGDGANGKNDGGVWGQGGDGGNGGRGGDGGKPGEGGHSDKPISATSIQGLVNSHSGTAGSGGTQRGTAGLGGTKGEGGKRSALGGAGKDGSPGSPGTGGEYKTASGNIYLTDATIIPGDPEVKSPTYGYIIGGNSNNSQLSVYIESTGVFEPTKSLEYVKEDNDDAYYLPSGENKHAILVYASDTKTCDIHKDTEYIYPYAFSGTKIENVVVPANVKNIGKYAFYNCTKLGRFTALSTLEDIGEYAFYMDSSLREVILPETMVRIRASAFKNCTSITQFTFPDGIETISNGVLSGASRLKYVVIPTSAMRIEDSAFENCKTLESIASNRTVKETGDIFNYNYIGSKAFYGCVSLEYVDLPEALTHIGDKAFENNITLKSISIPATTTEIGIDAFKGASKLREIKVDEENTNYSSKGNTLIRKEDNAIILGCMNSNVRQSGASSIESYAFYGIKFDKPLEILDGVILKENSITGCNGEIILLHEGDDSVHVNAITKGENTVVYAHSGTIDTKDEEGNTINKTFTSYDILFYGSHVNDKNIGEDASYIVYNAGTNSSEAKYAWVYVYGNGNTTKYTDEELKNGLNDNTLYIVTEIANIHRLNGDNFIVDGIKISGGITSIGDNLFAGLDTVTTVIVGKDVTSIGKNNFQQSKHNTLTVYFEGDCPQVDPDVFKIIDGGKYVTIIYDEDSHGWTHNGVEYICFIPGEGLSTVFPDGADPNTIPSVTTSENMNFTDFNGFDKYGIRYEAYDTNGDKIYVGAKVVGYRPSGYSDVEIPLKVLINGEKLNVSIIDKNAFNGASFTSISFYSYDSGRENGITEIESGAFVNCSSLIHIIGDNTFKSVVENAFNTNVVVDSEYTSWVADSIFAGAKVYISSTLYGNTDNTGIYYTVDLENKTAIVGRVSNQDDEAVNTSQARVKDVVINDYVTYNGEVYKVVGFDRYAFYGNNVVETIEFGEFIGEGQTDSTPAIWDCTFRDTDSLKEIKVENNKLYMAKNGILLGSPLTLDEDEEVIFTRLVKYPENKEGTSFVLPKDTTKDTTINITVIENYAFAGNNFLQSVNLDGVTVIGSHAFWNCVNLTTLEGSYQIHDLGNSAFENTAIKQFNFSESLSTIGERAFYNTDISNARINYNVISIGENAFGRCVNITRFAFFNYSGNTETETSITGKYIVKDGVLFERRDEGEGLILLQFPASMEKGADKVFTYDMHTEEGDTDYVYEISPEAFWGAKYVKEIKLNEKTTIVGSQAFANCKRLEYVYLGEGYVGTSHDKPEGLYSYNLFIDSGALEFIEVSPENENFMNDSNGILFSKDKSILYCYPAAIQRVDYNVPASVTKIYDAAFYGNTNVKRVVVGSTDQLYIGSRAFGNCTSLTEVFYVSDQIPVAAEKIYDNTPNTLTTYYKKEHGKNENSGWHEYYNEDNSGDEKWCERDVCYYNVMNQVPNDTIATNDYLINFRGTDGKPISGTYVIVTVYVQDKIKLEDGSEESVLVPHKFYLYTDEAGRISFSTLVADNQISSDIHIYAYKESYFPYDYDLHLDEDMFISYLTLTKEPDIFGIECETLVQDTTNGVSSKFVDINSQTAEINKAQFREDSEVVSSLDSNQNRNAAIQTQWGSVAITVVGFWDDAYGNPEFMLVQDGRRLNADVTIDGKVCKFIVPVSEFVTEVPVEAHLKVTLNGSDGSKDEDILSCRKILNINVIDFVLTEDDVNLDFNENVSFGDTSNPQLKLFQTLFGSDGFNLKLGDDVKINTNMNGSQIILTLTAEKSSPTTDFKKGYYEHYQPHGKGTYFYQYTDGHLTYNIRFVKSNVDNYYYYRLYVYKGLPGVRYTDALSEKGALYGAFNLFEWEMALPGREKVRARATALFLDISTWIYNNKIQEKLNEKEKNESDEKIGILEKKEEKDPLHGYTPALQEKCSNKDKHNKQNDHNFSVKFEGQLVFEYDRNGIKLASGSVKGSLTYAFKHNSQYTIWVIPVTLEVEVTLGGEILLRLKFDDGVSLEELSLTLKADIEASVGVGCSIASIGLYGGIGTVFVLDILPEFGIREWEIHGEFGAYVKALWFKKKFEIWSGTYYVIKDESTENSGSWSRVSKSRAMMYLVDEYEYAPECEENATIIQIRGEYYKIHFATVTNDNYDPYNCTKLCYSKWDEVNDTWSDPEIIDDNGYSDASYDIYYDEYDVYLVYTQQTKKLTADDIEDTYASAEGLAMYCVDLSKGFGRKYISTVNDGEVNSDYKYATAVSVHNGLPVVAWAQNSDNNLFGVSPENYFDEATNTSYVYGTTANSIWVSMEDGNGRWVNTCVADGLSSVVDIEICGDTVYYIIDKDGDLTDSSDCTLYTKKITDLDAEAEEFNESGSITSIENNDGKLMYYYVGEYEEGLYFITNEDYDLPEQTTMLQNGYVTVDDANGNIVAILYLDTETHDDGVTSSRIMGMFKNGDHWGDPVCVYDAYDDSVKLGAISGDVTSRKYLDIYISSFDAILKDGKLVLTMQLCDNEGTSLKNIKEYADYPDGIIVNAPTIYDIDEIKVDYRYEINYREQKVLFYIENLGAKDVVATIDGDSVTVISGKTEVIEVTMPTRVTRQIFDIEFNNGINNHKETTDNINTEFVDLVPLGKQIVIGSSNSLLVAIRNYGNLPSNGYEEIVGSDTEEAETKTTYGKLYVIPGVVANGFDERGACDIETIKSRAVYVQELTGPIGANRIVYYEIMLDEEILDGCDGIISLYVEYENEPEQTISNNLSAYYLSTISQTTDGTIEDDPEFIPSVDISSETIYTSANGTSGLELYVTSKGSNDEISVSIQGENSDSITMLEEDLHYNKVEAHRYIKTLALKEDYLATLSVGKYIITVTVNDEFEKEFIVNIVENKESEKTYSVIWIAEGNIEHTTFKDGDVVEYPNGDPVKEGYRFLGWDGNEDGLPDDTLAFDKEQTVTYTAVFEKIEEETVEYKITWVVWSKDNDDTVKNEVIIINTVKKGETPIAPDKFNGISITGWKDENGYATTVSPATKDTKYYAVYAKLAGEFTIEGEHSVGEILVANVMAVNGKHYVTYQWYRNGEAIEGATSNAYEIMPDDIGQTIYCVISGIEEYIGELVSNSVIASKHSHKMTYVDSNAATCTEDGNLAYWYCSQCDKYYVDVDANDYKSFDDLIVPATGHDYKSVVYPATCLTSGYTLHECQNCGLSHVDNFVDRLEHEAGEWIIKVEATCTNEGLKQTLCTKCGKLIETQSIDKLEHTPGEWIVDVVATCTKEGAEHIECTVCNTVLETKTVEKLEHTSSEWVVDVVATCTREGAEHIECTVCNTVLETKTVAKLEHTHNEWIEVPATCVGDGIKHILCTECGKLIETQPIEKLEHTPGEWVVDVVATCTKEGSEHIECTVCKTVLETKTVEKLEHVMGEWDALLEATCEHQGTELRKCNNCEYSEHRCIPALGHSFTDYVSNNDATYTEDGTKTAKCDRCEASDTIVDEGSALGMDQKFVDTVKNLSTDASTEATYVELYNALVIYNSLTEEEKAEVVDAYNTLQMQIKAYNKKAKTVNGELADASESALAAIIPSGFAFLAALWFLLKKKFLI